MDWSQVIGLTLTGIMVFTGAFTLYASTRHSNAGDLQTENERHIKERDEARRERDDALKRAEKADVLLEAFHFVFSPEVINEIFRKYEHRSTRD